MYTVATVESCGEEEVNTPTIYASNLSTCLMPSIITDVLFSEPSGRPNALIQFSGAVVFLLTYLYFSLPRNSTSSSWLLVLVAGFTLSGVAESLPKHRRKTAGVLRLTTMLLLAGFLGATLITPESVIG